MSLNHINSFSQWDFIVIGGGAAGYFGAIACAEANPNARVLILEATSRVLTKVKISGGGRCNVTHHQFDPKQLVKSYPRGQKELIGPFHRFQPQDTVAWFSKHGVELKVEKDGRMFPVTNDSQTVIDCLQHAAETSGVVLERNSLVQNITPHHDKSGFEIQIKSKTETLKATCVLMATGSTPYGVSLAASLGHQLISPVPSLFTFEIKDPLIEGLQGISFPLVHVTLKTGTDHQTFTQEGPCLITHWGLSGPAVLKLSAFAARPLHQSSYQAKIKINWIAPIKFETALDMLEDQKKRTPKSKLINGNPFSCVQRFWQSVLQASGASEDALFSETSRTQLQAIAQKLTQTQLNVTGKGVFKEEFVTAGGVSRTEIDFRTMESKIQTGLYFAGEVIDIDGITGGFNFQNAWTGGWLAGQAVASRV